MRRAVTSSALALCLVLAAIPGLGAQNGPQVQPPAGFPAAGAPPTVTLTSPGAQPRKALRFVIANGHREHMTMDTALAMTLAVGENSIPEVKLPLFRVGADLAVTAVSETGDMTISITFTDVNWIAASGSDPSVLGRLNSMTADLKGLSGTIVMSNRAVTREVKLDISRISNPEFLQLMAGVQQMVQNLSLPLPEEPVGIGATWDVRLGLTANGVQTSAKYSVEIGALDDTSCTLKVSLEQTAPPQSISNPAMSGATISVDSLNGTAAGTTKIQFDMLTPTSEVNSNSKMTMNIDTGGDAQQMNMAMTMRATITPGVPSRPGG